MTRGSNDKPVRRLLDSRSGDRYVVELRADLILMRPFRARRGGPLEVALIPGAVYLPALRTRLAAERSAKKKSRKRVS